VCRWESPRTGQFMFYVFVRHLTYFLLPNVSLFQSIHSNVYFHSKIFILW
jgi:hypothetical protein